MWDKIDKNLKKYSSTVLTAIDGQGSPYSIRCTPIVDQQQQILRFDLPSYVALQPGAASLLCHKHDEKLWNMESFLLKGELLREEQTWIFRPQQYIPGTPGTGPGALIASFRWLLACRRSAQKYLEKRQVKRPMVPWDEIQELKVQATLPPKLAND